MADDAGSRWISLLGATSLHIAVGLALMSPFISGVPQRGHATDDRGRAIVVDLIPLSRAGETAANASLPARGAPSVDAAVPPASPSRGTSPTQEAVGSMAAAEASESAMPGESAPSRSSADLSSAEVMAYRARLQAHLARYRIYPEAANMRGEQGMVVLHLIMNSDGKVVDAWIEASSGAGTIDDEAVAAVLRAQPLPAFPIGWPSQLGISVPVTYRL